MSAGTAWKEGAVQNSRRMDVRRTERAVRTIRRARGGIQGSCPWLAAARRGLEAVERQLHRGAECAGCPEDCALKNKQTRR